MFDIQGKILQKYKQIDNVPIQNLCPLKFQAFFQIYFISKRTKYFHKITFGWNDATILFPKEFRSAYKYDMRYKLYQYRQVMCKRGDNWKRGFYSSSIEWFF